VFSFRLQVCRPARGIFLLLWIFLRLIFWVRSEWLQLSLLCWWQRMWRILHQLCLQNKLPWWATSISTLVWLIILVVLSYTCWFDFSFISHLYSNHQFITLKQANQNIDFSLHKIIYYLLQSSYTFLQYKVVYLTTSNKKTMNKNLLIYWIWVC